MTDEQEQAAPTFDLDLTITRPDVVEWLEEVPAERLTEEVENKLAAGRLVLSLLEAGTGEESMRQFFRPVVDRMENLGGKLDTMLSAADKSQRLGEVGEQVVHEQLRLAFPGDAFSITAKEGHVADLHADFAIDGGETREAIIEVKLYSGDVPSKELTKFRKDLKTTGVRYGLMVSLTSRLTGIGGPIQLESTDDYVAVFVPNAGLDAFGVLWGAAVLKSIILYEARAAGARLVPSGAIQQAWSRLNNELLELRAISSEVNGFRGAISATREEVIASFEDLAEKALTTELRLQQSVDRITGRLAEELEGLPQTGAPDLLPAPAAEDEILAFLQKLRDAKDKRIGAFEGLYDVARQQSVEIGLDEEGAHWVLMRDGATLATTGGTKTRLDLRAQVAMDKPVSILPALENVKGTEVVISGKDAKAMLERAEVWLAKGEEA